MMKRFCFGLAVLLCSVSLHAQKTRYGQELPFAKPGVDYPLAVHVAGLRVRADCTEGYCDNILFVDVTVNGRKLELEGSSGIPEKPYKGPVLLSIGDFRGRVLKNASGMGIGDGYELVLPNNKVLPFLVTGVFE
jgi:hypothetical protein